MSDVIETKAWTSDAPWRGLGNEVDTNADTDTMLKAAGLDWEVEQHECFTIIDGKQVPVNRQALVRKDNQRVLSVTGNNWHPLQNRQALEFFNDYTRAGGAKLESAGSLRGGKIVWGLASVDKSFVLNGRDKVGGYILLISPHEVGKAITIHDMQMRFACTNMLARMNKHSGAAAYSQNHLREFDVEQAKEAVFLAQESLGQLELEAQALLQLQMSEFDTVRVLAKHFQPVEMPELSRKENKAAIMGLINDPATQNKAMSQVLEAYKLAPGANPGNAWGVLNAVTYWADHMAGREADARTYRSWLGHTGMRKEKVRQDLLEMVA